MVHIGTRVEILPAYNSETGCRDIYDEVAGCEAEILRFVGADAEVYVKAMGEVTISRARLRVLGGRS